MVTVEFCILVMYEHLRSSGFLILPHKSTLLKYIDFTTMPTGYNYDVIKKFINDIDLSTLSEHNMSLFFDEIKFKMWLVFSQFKRKVCWIYRFRCYQ